MKTLLGAGIALVALIPILAVADVGPPAHMQITEREAGLYAVQWRVPKVLPPRAVPAPEFPETCTAAGDREVQDQGGAWLFTREWRCEKSLAGQVVGMRYPFPDLALTTVVRVDLLSGDRFAHVLSPGEEPWRLPEGTAAPDLVAGARRALVGRVREEVLYREALAVGLDQNDVVVRRRMVQKMELLSQDLATLADPTDQELQAFFQERQEEYRVPPRVSFSHVYFNTDRRGPAAEEDARRALAELRAATPQPRRAPERGDRFMLQHDYALRSPLEVQQAFGARFGETLFELELGWHGPVVSGYGIHLVYVGERVEGRVPEYEEVRDRLVMDYNRMRRDRANELLYEGLVAGYDVVIDEETLQRAAPR